ncbi:Holliday junction branch migration protein RuvA [Microcella humidisoli]|uniref:Holliday junction branch migration complex subunit RuvA n=1 Tax=Microcella humidisoli TaxID=2963406 RepID=A0ABY5FVQ5_9MICO|nr:Holliday junction branch migration protein RuvA [Microcella humidisoli]UTT62385.1 Holliday junction branch migration protein RuvA [Microcella humidisoli]
MIASLRGTLIVLAGTRVVIDVAGVGYAVAVTERHARELRVGDSVRLHTALVVREDDMSLYGFADEIELGLFELLRTVSGVGPKSALGVLGEMTPDAIARAIAADDDAPFRAVSGIGPKTAKLIVVSLAGKLLAPVGTAPVGSPAAPAAVTASLAAALTGLGWPERTALDAAAQVVEADPDAATTGLAVLLRRALSILGPARGRSDGAGGGS